MENPKWQFASTEGGREDDVSNALIEMFEGDYNFYLAREILQNAIDAHDPVKKDPVSVEFKLEHYTPDMIPGHDELIKIFKSAKKFWPDEKEKCHQFLDQAISCLNQEKIPVLKISDYNTIGLNGDDGDRNSPWYGLVKSVGSTTKIGGEGGSYGLGKGAPFASSQIRTLFYSTRNKIGQTVFQGVAELVSHQDDESDVKRGSGSYGFNKQRSIRDMKIIPYHMVRKERGTDIYVIGYKITDEWQKKLIESILRNFWLAIESGKVVIDVDGEYLNSTNLEEKLKSYFIDKPLLDVTRPQGNPLYYYKAFKEGKKFEDKFAILGNVSFYFSKTEEHLNLVTMLRASNMVISSRPFHFPGHYAGVFLCEDEQGNKELRKMDTPQHDRWDPARNKENGYAIEEELKGFIRGCLKQLTKLQSGGILEIPDLYKYLPFDPEGSSPGGGHGFEEIGKQGEEETAKEMGEQDETITDINITPFKVSVLNTSKKGFGDGGVVLRKGKRKIKKGEPAPGVGKGEIDALLKSSLKSRTFIIKDSALSQTYESVITSDLEGKCKLKFRAIGEEGDERVKLLNAKLDSGDKLICTHSRIMKVPLVKGEIRIRFEIENEKKLKLSLKLEAYDLQQ